MRFGKGASGSVMRQPTHEINNEDDYARRLELDFEQFEEDIALPEEVINKYSIMYYQPLDREDEFMKKYWKDVIKEKKKREEEETNAYKEEIQQAEEVEKSGRGIKKNAWIEHCKKYQQKHNCSWKEAMIGAKATYKKGNGIFSKKQLTNIILHKNKVIEDLEEEAYKSGGFIVDPKTGRMYHDNDPKAQKWKK
jgi:hypothetical protein